MTGRDDLRHLHQHWVAAGLGPVPRAVLVAAWLLEDDDAFCRATLDGLAIVADQSPTAVRNHLEIAEVLGLVEVGTMVLCEHHSGGNPGDTIIAFRLVIAFDDDCTACHLDLAAAAS